MSFESDSPSASRARLPSASTPTSEPFRNSDARGLNKPIERKQARLAHLERLGNRQRPVGELALR